MPQKFCSILLSDSPQAHCQVAIAVSAKFEVLLLLSSVALLVLPQRMESEASVSVEANVVEALWSFVSSKLSMREALSSSAGASFASLPHLYFVSSAEGLRCFDEAGRAELDLTVRILEMLLGVQGS